MTREELLRREYLGRIERVVDYIYAHCGEELTLDDLADVAAFSRFHFHRVFSSLLGETVSDFVKRLRLQRAAGRLVDHPEESVTDVASACGFSNPSVFARSFKERFGVTASRWRSLDRSARRRLAGGPGEGEERKDGQVSGKDGQAPQAQRGYLLSIVEERRPVVDSLPFTVDVVELPELIVAYARHVGPFDGIPEAFARLGRWAGPRGLFAREGALTLAVYHDAPETTAPEQLRSSACLSVPQGTEVSGDINLMTIPGGKFAVARFEISPDQFGAAWDAFMGGWMPSSGYQPDDRLCYELYRATPEGHPEGKFIIDICEPVRPL